MIACKIIDKAFDFYNIDNKYKEICYNCAEEINNSEINTEAFNKVYKRLYCKDFNDLKKLWSIFVIHGY